MTQLKVLQADCQSFMSNSSSIGQDTIRLTGFFDNFLPKITNAFQVATSFSTTPHYVGLSREQGELLTKLEKHNYAEVREIKAFVPENFVGKFLPYVTELEQCVDHVLQFHSEVLDPYLSFLAGITSEKSARLSSHDHVQNNKKYEEVRSALEKKLTDNFKSSKNDTASRVGQVCERNADWKPIIEGMVSLSSKLERVNLKNLQMKVNIAGDYLESIYHLVKLDQMKNSTPEVLNHLADGAYQIAAELEFISVTYYRCLTLTQAIKDTIDSLNKAIP
jgi:hypothetical protein